MQPDFLGFFQERMATAYQEQTWAVAIVGALNAFVASHASLLLRGFRRWLVLTAVWLTSILALGFVWSRHLIYLHYDECVKAALNVAASGYLCGPSRVQPLYSFLARWSGVTLYSLIIVGLFFTAIRLVSVSGHDENA